MGAVEFVRCRLNTSLTEPLADPGIVIAEPHEANRIVVGQLVEEFLFAFGFEADHRGEWGIRTLTSQSRRLLARTLVQAYSVVI